MFVVFDSLNSFNLLKANDVNNIEENSTLIIKFVKDIEYFNSTHKDVNDFLIVNVERYIFYCDLYVFVNHLKNLTREFVKK